MTQIISNHLGILGLCPKNDFKPFNPLHHLQALGAFRRNEAPARCVEKDPMVDQWWAPMIDQGKGLENDSWRMFKDVYIRLKMSLLNIA